MEPTSLIGELPWQKLGAIGFFVLLAQAMQGFITYKLVALLLDRLTPPKD